jgi:hypothetical protein
MVTKPVRISNVLVVELLALAMSDKAMLSDEQR